MVIKAIEAGSGTVAMWLVTSKKVPDIGVPSPNPEVELKLLNGVLLTITPAKAEFTPLVKVYKPPRLVLALNTSKFTSSYTLPPLIRLPFASVM